MKAVVASCVIILFATALLRAQQVPTFRSQVDLVNFGVVVTDKQGSPITGLTVDDFEIKKESRRRSSSLPLATPATRRRCTSDSCSTRAGAWKRTSRTCVPPPSSF
jgi:hypothetical protein